MMMKIIGRLHLFGGLEIIDGAVVNFSQCFFDVGKSISNPVGSKVLSRGTKLIFENERRIARVENGDAEIDVPLSILCTRPKVAEHFVGREEELQRLTRILHEYGSATISHSRGIGKTQLMAAFAEKAEQSGLVPSGTYWVSVHGPRTKVLHSLADFTEALTETRLRETERNDFTAVLNALKNKLESIQSNWVLCVDNADDEAGNSFVGHIAQLSSIAGGWVIFSSGQECGGILTDLVAPQKLEDAPLSCMDSMVALCGGRVIWGRKRFLTQML